MRRVVAAIVVWAGVAASAAGPVDVAYVWQLPAGVAGPPIPEGNPMSAAKVELGRRLFHDTRLSGNGTQSCASCHRQELAFTDGRPRSAGSTGQLHPRGSMSLVNVAYARTLAWGNPSLTSLEDQALVPMFGEHPIELGLDRTGRWTRSIAEDTEYAPLFDAAFPDLVTRISTDTVVKAIAAFERSIVSMRAPYDRYHYERDDNAVSDAAKRGEVLFHSRPLSCFTCHGGPFFSDSMGSNRQQLPPFHNTGLYNLANGVSYPPENTGIHELTRAPSDVGKFKTPTLRNIAVTGPYMHDGSIATLDEVIDHYAVGGRTIATGPFQGVGRDNPNKDRALQGFVLTLDQKADLIAFLETLTDEELMKDPAFADPRRQAPVRR